MVVEAKHSKKKSLCGSDLVKAQAMICNSCRCLDIKEVLRSQSILTLVCYSRLYTNQSVSLAIVMIPLITYAK